MDKACAFEPASAVADLDCREYWHVAGAFCDCGNQLASRFFAFIMGHVSAFGLGLVHVHRHHWFLPFVGVSVHPLLTDDFDLRDAHDFAGSG